MKTIDEMIAIMQAARDGKEIEEKHVYDLESGFPVDDSKWCLCRGTIKPRWDWSQFDYRVKPPEPRRWKIHIHPKSPHEAAVCHTPEACAREGYEVVEVEEVMK